MLPNTQHALSELFPPDGQIRSPGSVGPVEWHLLPHDHAVFVAEVIELFRLDYRSTAVQSQQTLAAELGRPDHPFLTLRRKLKNIVARHPARALGIKRPAVGHP